MKTIGLLGGMSWESTALYYRHINSGIHQRLGGFHSAKIVLISIDFHHIELLINSGEWQQAGDILAANCRQIEAAGADFLMICTNTIHKMADRLQSAVSIPLLHLADATAKKIKSDDRQKVGLLGTRTTMVDDFYRGRLHDNHGLEVLIPTNTDMDIIHRVIFEELCKGRQSENSRKDYLRIINDLYERGAEAMVLGCTEICMLVNQSHTTVPLYNTTEIHAEAAVKMALSESQYAI